MEYKKYSPNTKVKIKSTGEVGEAFESTLGFISVFIEDKCDYFRIDEVEFI